MVHQYKLGKYNIIIDSCSGSVHAVDDVAYDLIKEFESKEKAQIVEELTQKYKNNPEISAEEISECYDQVAFLKEKGLYDKLTLRLQDAIRLREEYPDSTLSELSDYSSNILGKHLSKSGISHCLRELMKIYETYQTKKDKLNN